MLNETNTLPLPFLHPTFNFLPILRSCEKDTSKSSVCYRESKSFTYFCEENTSTKLQKLAWKVKFTHLLSPGQTESQVDASGKLGATCDTFWPGLACTCVDLSWLAMTCAHFGRDQICTQVKASFSPFGHPTQVNACWLTSINLLLTNEIEDSLP